MSKNYIAKWDSVMVGDQVLNIAMMGIHFLAFPDDASRCPRREAQAVVTRQAIDTLWAEGALPTPDSDSDLASVLPGHELCPVAVDVCDSAHACAQS